MSSPRPVNILFCESNVDGTVGGSYYSLLYLIKGLDRSRFRPKVVFYTDHSLMPAFRDAGAETLVWPRSTAFAFGTRLPATLGPLRLPALGLQKGLNLIKGFVGPTLARMRFLKEHDISIVHLNNSILYNHDWMAAATLAGRICVSHERGINDLYPGRARFFGSRLHAIICISRAVAENMRLHGAGFPNLTTVHNGLDPAMMRLSAPLDQLRKSLGIAAGDPVVVMIGNIKNWKGQHTVIRAMARVGCVNLAVRCVFVGATSPGDQEYEQTLHRLAAEYGVADNIIFAGFQHNVADFLMLSDVVVHASVLPEPFGRVILEAMACRKPVIGSRGGAITELVVEEETGLTFPPDDSDALADAIVRLVNDPELAGRMGDSGYDRLVREFHIDRNVETTQKLYEILLHAY